MKLTLRSIPIAFFALLISSFSVLGQDGVQDTTFNYGYSLFYSSQNQTPGAGATGSATSRIDAILPDGARGFYLKGGFSFYNGRTLAAPIAHIYANGGVDTLFKPAALGGTLTSVLPATDGHVYVYGALTNYGGVRDSSIYKLNRFGQRVSGFRTGAFRRNASVGNINALLELADSTLLVGGSFNSVQSTAVSGLVRIGKDGRLRSGFTATLSANSAVTGIVKYDDNRYIIWGSFTTYNGLSANGVARIYADGTLDPFFITPTFNAVLTKITIRPDKKVLVAGAFTQVGSNNGRGVALLDSSGTHITSFVVSAVTGGVMGAEYYGPNRNVVYGDFTGLNGFASNSIVLVLNDQGAVVNSFSGTIKPNDAVRDVYYGADGTLLLAGEFTQLGSNLAGRIARINRFSRYDYTFNSGRGASARAYKFREIRTGAHQGKYMLAGEFTHFNNRFTGPICRLNTDGTVDTTFTPPSFGTTSIIFDMEIQTDGKILVGGNWQGSGGTPANLARLNADGTLDNTFTQGTGPNSYVEHIEIDANGRIWIAGFFNQYNGTNRPGMARLQSTGVLDNTFSPARGFERSGNVVVPTVLRVLASGRTISAGNFTSFNGTAINNIVVLQTNGVVAPNVNFGTGITSSGTQSQASVSDIVELSDGKLLIAGSFDTYNGNAVNKIFRTSASGAYDNTFTPNRPFAAGIGGKIAVQRNGAILLSGNIMSFENRGKEYWLARLSGINGALDTTFKANQTGLFTPVLDLSLSATGKILYSGNFLRAGNLQRGHANVLNNDDNCQITVITTQPRLVDACAGDSAVFSVAHTGTGPFSYRWLRGTTTIETTAVPRLVMYNVSGASAGAVSVVIVGRCGVVVSTAAALTVNTRASVKASLASAAVCLGSTHTFSVPVAGSSLSYRWFRGNTQVGNAATYRVGAMTLADTGNYYLIVSNACGSDTSTVARLTSITPTTIFMQNSSINRLCAGSRLVLKGIVTGAYSSLVWRRGATNLSTTTDSLVIANLTAADTGRYTMVLTTACGTVTSVPIQVSLIAPTRILTQPTAVTLCSGDNLFLSVTGAGDNINYQWYRNGTRNAVTATVQVQGATRAAAGWYKVDVSGTCGTIRSDSVLVTVNEHSDTTVNATINQGDIYTFGGRQFTQSGTYNFTILNRAGCDSSITVNLTVIVGLADALGALKVWPNPAHDILTVSGLAADVAYTVQDQLGRVVLKGVLWATNEQKISLEDLPSGVYTLGLGAGIGQISTRFTKL